MCEVQTYDNRLRCPETVEAPPPQVIDDEERVVAYASIF